MTPDTGTIGTVPHVDTDAVVALWVESLQECWHLARGERAGELRGAHSKLLDARGMHPYSEAWGRVKAAERLLPDLAVVRVGTGPAPCEPVTLRRLAAQQAQEDFAAEVIAQGGVGVFA